MVAPAGCLNCLTPPLLEPFQKGGLDRVLDPIIYPRDKRCISGVDKKGGPIVREPCHFPYDANGCYTTPPFFLRNILLILAFKDLDQVFFIKETPGAYYFGESGTSIVKHVTNLR